MLTIDDGLCGGCASSICTVISISIVVVVAAAAGHDENIIMRANGHTNTKNNGLQYSHEHCKNRMGWRAVPGQQWVVTDAHY